VCSSDLDSPLWVDDQEQSGKQVFIPTGLHQIRIHKKNWYHVEPDITTLAELIGADPLYPYNHKLLIEGYAYASDFDSPEDEVYTGVDFFAQYKMQKIRIFEFLNQISSDDLKKFAVDYDLAESYDNATPNMLFVVKVDETLSDAINEQFLIKFKMVDQKYKYLRLRVDFNTSDINLTPVLMSYKIKLG
jgi:hypothetical protein